jgi:hypothetical protein
MKRVLSTAFVSSCLLVLPSLLLSSFASANQYVGAGLEYGLLSHESTTEDYSLINFETRLGLDFSDRFGIEVEGSILGNNSREFSQECLNQDVQDFLRLQIECGYLDKVSRQSLSVNFLYYYPLASFEIFTGFGVGAVRTKYDFSVQAVNSQNNEIPISGIQSLQRYLDSFSAIDGVEYIDLQLADSISETAIDVLYSLEAGAIIDDQHRVSLTWNPAYGSDQVGEYSYVGFSYSWLFRFSD